MLTAVTHFQGGGGEQFGLRDIKAVRFTLFPLSHTPPTPSFSLARSIFLPSSLYYCCLFLLLLPPPLPPPPLSLSQVHTDTHTQRRQSGQCDLCLGSVLRGSFRSSPRAFNLLCPTMDSCIKLVMNAAHKTQLCYGNQERRAAYLANRSV